MTKAAETPQQVVSRFPDPGSNSDVTYEPTPDQLRGFSSHLETTTEFGAPSYVSQAKSRAAEKTKNTVDHEFTETDWEFIDAALSAVDREKLVCLDRRVGRHPENSYHCRYYVPERYSRIAFSLSKLLEPAEMDGEPDFVTVQLPEWAETKIRVLPEQGVTIIAGSDYFGEAKKSFLRLFMHEAKQQGGLGLHAGSKRVRLQTDDGLETVGQLFLGLSGTGKSTLTAHGLRLENPEGATMLQDDVCALRPDGTVAGSEGRGLFIKTHGLDVATEPELFDAATDESAVLENVDVAADGTVEFDSDRYTTNGRAIIQREKLSSAGDEIDLPEVDQIFFITRNPAMPIAARLSPEQAAVAFMLGESVQTSAGDPTAAGESVRVVGTNPFIIGSNGAEGNRFRDLIAELDVECYVLNTGRVGSTDVGVEDTVKVLRAITRGSVQWTTDAATGLTVPASAPDVDLAAFDPTANLSDYEETVADLRRERARYLAQFDDLDESIRNALY